MTIQRCTAKRQAATTRQREVSREEDAAPSRQHDNDMRACPATSAESLGLRDSTRPRRLPTPQPQPDAYPSTCSGGKPATSIRRQPKSSIAV